MVGFPFFSFPFRHLFHFIPPSTPRKFFPFFPPRNLPALFFLYLFHPNRFLLPSVAWAAVSLVNNSFPLFPFADFLVESNVSPLAARFKQLFFSLSQGVTCDFHYFSIIRRGLPPFFFSPPEKPDRFPSRSSSTFFLSLFLTFSFSCRKRKRIISFFPLRLGRWLRVDTAPPHYSVGVPLFRGRGVSPHPL